jgi:signal transduction histidine kinase
LVAPACKPFEARGATARAQISSSVELIQLLSNNDGRLKPYVVRASQAAAHVWNLIERASRAADVEEFVRQSQSRLININHLLAQLIASHRQIYFGVDFRLESIASIYVHSDPALIKEAVGNLLVIAVSFAREGIAVKVAYDPLICWSSASASPGCAPLQRP